MEPKKPKMPLYLKKKNEAKETVVLYEAILKIKKCICILRWLNNYIRNNTKFCQNNHLVTKKKKQTNISNKLAYDKKCRRTVK